MRRLMKITIIDHVWSRCERADIPKLREFLFIEKAYYQPGRFRSIRREYTKFLVDRSGRFLTGFIPQIQQKIGEVSIQDNSTPRLPKYRELGTPNPTVILRPEQVGALDAIFKYQRGVIHLPTGSGKTLIFLSLIQQLHPETEVLIIVHTQDLLTQTLQRAEQMFPGQVGVIGAGEVNLNRINIAMIQTLYRLNIQDAFEKLDVVIGDECFHGETKIQTETGEKAIKDIISEDKVYSSKGIQIVKQIFANKVHVGRVVKLTLSNEKKIFCSKEHRFYTQEAGWANAINLHKRFLFTFSEKDYAIRVESVEIYQPGSNDQSFEGVISNQERDQGYTYFYDLEVEKSHNYFAEGVLVHNCHHLSTLSGTYAKVLEQLPNTPMRLGFTGTLPYTTEGKMTLEGYIGPVIFSKSIKEVKSLAKPRIILRKVPFSQELRDLRIWKEVYKLGIVFNSRFHRIVLEEAEKQNQMGKSVLILIGSEIQQGHNLMEMATKRFPDLKILFVWGNTPTKDRIKTKEFLESKKVGTVIANVIWQEGIDIPNLDVVINAAQNKSEIMTIQRLGRGLRTTETKKEMILIDFFDGSNRYFVDHFGERISTYFDQGWL